MISQAKGKFIRISPMKVRQVIDLIRGKDVPSSSMVLLHTKKGASDLVSRVLNSAVSNAKQKGLNEDQLYISKIVADQGPSWKRYRAAGATALQRISRDGRSLGTDHRGDHARDSWCGRAPLCKR